MAVTVSDLTERIRLRRAGRSVVLGWPARIGVSFLVLVTLVAGFGSLIAPHRTGELVAEPFQPPSWSNWMGSDNVGKDVFSELIHGTRVTFMVGVIAASASLFAGLIVGSVAGYVGGRVDAVLMRIAEFFQILPGLLLALVVAALLGRQMIYLIFAIALTSWPESARLIRSQFLTLREREFVEAARGIGFPRRYIIAREILPNALAPAIVQATLDVGSAILIAASLSFLGLGDPEVASWGDMLNSAQRYLDKAWWMAVFPGAAIFAVVLATNIVGDAVTDALDPRTRREAR